MGFILSGVPLNSILGKIKKDAQDGTTALQLNNDMINNIYDSFVVDSVEKPMGETSINLMSNDITNLSKRLL